MAEYFFAWAFADTWFPEVSKKNPLRFSRPRALKEALYADLKDKNPETEGEGRRMARPVFVKWFETENSQYKEMWRVETYNELATHMAEIAEPCGIQDTPLTKFVHNHCAVLSNKIYDDLDDPELDMKSWAWDDETTIIGVDRRADHIFVVFRGTDNFYGWIKNLSCKHDKTEDWTSYGLHVHQGYWVALSSCIDNILDRLQTEFAKANHEKGVRRRGSDGDNLNLKLVITGHSQGSGLAMLLHARLWILRQTDRVFSGREHVPGMMELLESAQCVVMAGPMVFAPMDKLDRERMDKLKKFSNFMRDTTTNYMFYNDPVPRAPSAIEIKKVVGEAGMALEKNIRFYARCSMVGGAGGLALAVGTAGIGSAVAGGIFLALGAAGEIADRNKFAVWRRDVKEAVMNQELLKRYGKDYRHCAQIRVFRESNAHWKEFECSESAFANHSMVNYEQACQLRVNRGEFHQFTADLSDLIEHRCPDVEEVSPEVWLSLYNQAREYCHWDRVMRTLRTQPLGSINTVEIMDGGAQKPWHFIHQAAFFGRKDIVVQLLQLGADPLLQTQDGESVAKVALKGYAEGVIDGDTANGVAWFEGVEKRAESYRRLLGLEKAEYAVAVAEALAADRDQILKDLTQQECIHLVHRKLSVCGYLDAQILAGKPDEFETFSEAEERIKANFPVAADAAVKLEKAHLFLDAAKFRKYEDMRQMLLEDPSLAIRGPDFDEPRWTAIMQLAFCGGPMDDVRAILARYPNASEVASVTKDMDFVKKFIAEEKKKAAKQSPEEVAQQTPSRFMRARASAEDAVASPQESDDDEVASPQRVKSLVQSIVDGERRLDDFKALVDAAAAPGPAAASAPGSAPAPAPAHEPAPAPSERQDDVDDFVEAAAAPGPTPAPEPEPHGYPTAPAAHAPPQPYP